MNPRIKQLKDFVSRHRAAVLGTSYGAGALLLFLLLAGVMGRAARSNAEESEAMIQRRFEEARSRRATQAPRVEVRRKAPPRRRPAPAGRPEYEVRTREEEVSTVPAEVLPSIDAPPEETSGEILPEIPPGQGDELSDPEG